VLHHPEQLWASALGHRAQLAPGRRAPLPQPTDASPAGIPGEGALSSCAGTMCSRQGREVRVTQAVVVLGL
jgi:hypothetical protein